MMLHRKTARIAALILVMILAASATAACGNIKGDAAVVSALNE